MSGTADDKSEFKLVIHVFGIAGPFHFGLIADEGIYNDLSARDIQGREGQLGLGPTKYWTKVRLRAPMRVMHHLAKIGKHSRIGRREM